MLRVIITAGKCQDVANEDNTRAVNRARIKMRSPFSLPTFQREEGRRGGIGGCRKTGVLSLSLFRLVKRIIHRETIY